MNRRIWRGKQRKPGVIALLLLLASSPGCSAVATGSSSGEGQVRMVYVEGGPHGPAIRGDWEEAKRGRHVRCGLDDVKYDDLGEDLDSSVPRRGWNSHQPDGADRCGDDYETLLFRLGNCERQARDLPPLECDLRLVWAGRAHSRDMEERRYFSHFSPEGLSPVDRLSARGMEFAASGENIALAPTMAFVHHGWMMSRGHRESILSRDFTHSGVGVVESEDGYLATTLFSADF